MKKLFIVLGLACLVACAKNASKTTSADNSAPSQADVDRVQAKYAGYTLAELTEGKALYEKNCVNCHKLYAPKSQSEAGWRKEVPPMVKKANKKAGSEVITAASQEKILRYVVTMATK